MTFAEMRDMLNEHFTEMVKNVTHLFEVQVDKDEMVNLYLDSFPKGTNEIYRKRREFDCSCCRGFIKNLGNVIAIKDGKIETIWSFDPGDDVFAPVVKKLDEYVRAHVITDVFLSKDKKIGCHHNFDKEIIEKIGPKRWDHFYIELDDKFVIRNAETKGAKLNEYRSARDVLKRSLDEITLDAVDAILDLINTNTLYKGMEYKNMIDTFRKLKVEYDKLTDDEKAIFAWEQSVKVGPVVSRIRNHAIGTLLVDVSEGKSLEDAVKSYEQMVAPANYKRSKPIFTQKMLDDAQKSIEELGYKDSLPRRYATLGDITVNDIEFVNKDAASRVQGATDIFGELSGMVSGKSKPKKFDKVEEISIENFMKNVVPTATSIEAYFGNEQIPNLVSLIAPVNDGVKSMFKWGNNFTWAYRGNITDSMKERVKAAGGNVEGDLRFSIQWNEEGTDNCDLDAHCREADGFELYFGNGRKPDYSRTKGQLDVDIIDPAGKIAVENITWKDKKTLKPGTYRFFVHQYSGSAKKGFRAEIEIEGQIFNFDYPHSMRPSEKVDVAEVIVNNVNGVNKLELKPVLSCEQSSKTVWNLSTNQFIPVTVICNSPNYWSTVENPTGHKHVFFMLKDCINDENPSGIFNEFLVQELYEHRRVMEAIGGRMRVADSDDQLSGLGFALDKRAELTVKVTGATERVLKIKF